MQSVRVAVVGASGYTGAELARLLLGHPHVSLTALYAHKAAGEPIAKHFPQLTGAPLPHPTFLPFSADDVAARAEVAFLGLPHGESVPAAKALVERGLRVFDLSADFRLRDADEYARWYGPHGAPELLPGAIYGLVERHRAALADARLVAVPGCYPTATLLALCPLVDAGLISPEGIIVDAKSGVSGAGRSPSLGTHFSEIGEGVRAYKVAEHRHTPEIEQELARAARRPVCITFTPHLIPMTRGILSTAYAVPTESTRDRTAYLEALRAAYAREPFVSVTEHPPDTSHVRGSNRVHVSAWVDARAGRVVVMGAIDNLVKGASGQAIQCLNAAFGWPETTALAAFAPFP
jgi:N-acetyl-gamma-glutamyl-phosphate reductase